MGMYDEQIRQMESGSGNSTHDCPDCGHHKLSVRRLDGNILYHCWRASCGIRGAIPLVGREALEIIEAKPNLEEAYRGPVSFLSDLEAAALSQRFELTLESIERWVRKTTGCYALPIYTREGWVRGYTIREAWTGTELADRARIGWSEKSKTYGGYAANKPLQSWYRPADRNDENDCYIHGPLVLVEDQISAMRVAQDLKRDAVALLGVALNAEKVADIQAEKMDVVIALDADATRIAFEHARRWGRAFTSCRVVILTKDIKDMTLEEIRAIPL